MDKFDFVEVLSLRGSFGYTGSIDRNALPFTYLTFANLHLKVFSLSAVKGV